jgi:hypothetical protein
LVFISFSTSWNISLIFKFSRNAVPFSSIINLHVKVCCFCYFELLLFTFKIFSNVLSKLRMFWQGPGIRGSENSETVLAEVSSGFSGSVQANAKIEPWSRPRLPPPKSLNFDNSPLNAVCWIPTLHAYNPPPFCGFTYGVRAATGWSYMISTEETMITFYTTLI